tara:strand:+ start:1317 stop:3008 length:1692 start_codon:yes stop_codon:yes gene_type:complete
MVKMFDKIKNNVGSLFHVYLWVLIILIIIGIVFYYRWELSKKNSEPNKMKSQYSNSDKYSKRNIQSINSSNTIYQYPLVNYYIKGSYNSCCAGDFYNSYVTLKPLEIIIKTGARVLDFQIYSINGEPVIAASSNDLLSLKGSYNYLTLDEVFAVITKYAFTCRNGEDPLFLNFRIYSEKTNIYPKLAQAISNHFGRKLLGPEYGKEGVSGEIITDGDRSRLGNKQLSFTPLNELKNSVIIMADQKNLNFKNKNNQFYQLVNLTRNSESFTYKRYYDIKYTSNITSLKNNNKTNITCVMPDWSQVTDNYNSVINFNTGCQINLMNYQNLDDNMKFYLDKFNKNLDSNGGPSAFVLKPENLRFTGVEIKKPTPQKPCLRQEMNPLKLLGGKVVIDKGFSCKKDLTTSSILFNDIGKNDKKIKERKLKINNLFKPNNELDWDLKWSLVNKNKDIDETKKNISTLLEDLNNYLIVIQNDNEDIIVLYFKQNGDNITCKEINFPNIRLSVNYDKVIVNNENTLLSISNNIKQHVVRVKGNDINIITNGTEKTIKTLEIFSSIKNPMLN